MKKFMDENFLLSTPSAQHLFHDYAAKMPIVDYHCHINPKRLLKIENLRISLRFGSVAITTSGVR